VETDFGRDRTLGRTHRRDQEPTLIIGLTVAGLADGSGLNDCGSFPGFCELPFDASLTAAYDSMTVRGSHHLSFQMFRMPPRNHSAVSAPNAAIIGIAIIAGTPIIAGTIIAGTRRP